MAFIWQEFKSECETRKEITVIMFTAPERMDEQSGAGDADSLKASFSGRSVDKEMASPKSLFRES
jgi:hypothetical protein